jgi:hypothetical protein
MAVSILFLHKGFGTDGYHGKVSVQIGNGLLEIANASVANGSSRLRMDRSVLGTHRSRLRMDGTRLRMDRSSLRFMKPFRGGFRPEAFPGESNRNSHILPYPCPHEFVPRILPLLIEASLVFVLLMGRLWSTKL